MKKETAKDRLLGVVITMISSAVMFLVYNLIGSFETKAGSESKYSTAIIEIKKIDKKIDLALCYMNKVHCLKEGK